MNSLITHEQLCEWTGCRQKKSLITWMNKNYIPFKISKDGWPITTQAAIDESLVKKNTFDEVEFL